MGEEIKISVIATGFDEGYEAAGFGGANLFASQRFGG